MRSKNKNQELVTNFPELLLSETSYFRGSLELPNESRRYEADWGNSKDDDKINFTDRKIKIIIRRKKAMPSEKETAHLYVFITCHLRSDLVMMAQSFRPDKTLFYRTYRSDSVKV